ncbi:MAG: mechanosensitive ion channel family protein [Actinomycetota bacterium]
MSSVDTPLAAQTIDEIGACGLDNPSRVCTTIYEWTGNSTLAGLSEWLIDRPVRVLIIVGLAWLINRFARRAISAFSDGIRSQPSHPRLRMLRRLGPGADEMNRSEADRAPARAEAIESVLKSLVTVSTFCVALLLVLGEFDINLAPLLAGAGVVGIAIGFGAQSIVSDFLAGTFMLIEDQFGVGDVIEIEGVVGEVESISLRTTKLRDIGGTVWHIPNGTIRKVGNHSQLWSNAVVDIDVAYGVDLREAMALMNHVSDDYWRETHVDGIVGDIIEDPTVLGVQALGDNAITLRLVVKTDPSAQWRVQRELRLRLKEAFDDAGIEIPFPQRVVHLHQPTTD